MLIKNKKGHMLVELVITLAIFGMVLALVSNFIGFGTKVFSRGENKSEIQNEVNLATYTITNALRNVKGISLEAKQGYDKFNIRNQFPSLHVVKYELKNNNGIYSLYYEIAQEYYTVKSEFILNNVTSAEIGTSNDYLWIIAEK